MQMQQYMEKTTYCDISVIKITKHQVFARSVYQLLDQRVQFTLFSVCSMFRFLTSETVTRICAVLLGNTLFSTFGPAASLNLSIRPASLPSDIRAAVNHSSAGSSPGKRSRAGCLFVFLSLAAVPLKTSLFPRDLSSTNSSLPVANKERCEWILIDWTLSKAHCFAARLHR